MKSLTCHITLLFFVAATAGCSGSLSPLYSDFRIEDRDAGADSTTTPIQVDIGEALQEAGWVLDDAASDNAVSTTERKVIHWGLYKVVVSLDVVPINNKFVRVYVHPYRHYFYGSRSKMGYMNRRVRTAVFPELTAAFKSRGIVSLGPIDIAPDYEAPEEEQEDDDDAEKAADKAFHQ